jgi:predicted enzyme related to lactoylglutathione lyase
MAVDSLQPAEHDRRIDYIEFAVTDVAASKRFYAQAFGWEFEDYGPDYASFRDGRIAGGLRKVERVSPGGPLVVVFALDLESAQAAVTAAGGRIVQPTFSFPGGRRFHFTDPSGNELAIWSDR